MMYTDPVWVWEILWVCLALLGLGILALRANIAIAKTRRLRRAFFFPIRTKKEFTWMIVALVIIVSLLGAGLTYLRFRKKKEMSPEAFMKRLKELNEKEQTVSPSKR